MLESTAVYNHWTKGGKLVTEAHSCLTQTPRDGCAVLDGLHAHRGFDPLHSWHLRDLHAQQAVELRDAGHQDVHEVVGLARCGEALKGHRMLWHPRLKLHVLARA